MKPPVSVPVLLAVACTAASAAGQIIAYESFAGMSLVSGVAGSGSDAAGWTGPGWVGGSDARFQVIDSAPNLTYQIEGGGLINGGDRAVRISTDPEPVPALLSCTRSITAQNSTVYVSFLARIAAIGTGSDSIDVRFNDGGTSLGKIVFRPDQAQRYVQASLASDRGGGFTSGSGFGGPLYPGATYLVVVQITRPSAASLNARLWVNPHATYGLSGSNGMSTTVASTAVFNTLALSVSSTDTGGPTTSMAIDEIRIGYTWTDVVPPAPPPATVPVVHISPAVKVRWQTVSGAKYQVQYSYDLTTWVNFGAQVSGDGTIKSVFDSADEDAKRFYRIQIK